MIKETRAQATKESLHHMGLIYIIDAYDDSHIIPTMKSEDSLGAAWYNLNDISDDMITPFVRYAIQHITNRA